MTAGTYRSAGRLIIYARFDKEAELNATSCTTCHGPAEGCKESTQPQPQLRRNKLDICPLIFTRGVRRISQRASSHRPMVRLHARRRHGSVRCNYPRTMVRWHMRLNPIIYRLPSTLYLAAQHPVQQQHLLQSSPQPAPSIPTPIPSPPTTSPTPHRATQSS
jgi:hypothetical protein